MERRTFVKTTGASMLATGGLAGCMGDGGGDDGSDGGNGDGDGSDGGDGGEPQSFGGYMEDARNYDGVVDETGKDAVTVDVGAGDEGFAFDPAAVRVSPGTEVTWEWTGRGGGHNVVAAEGEDVELMESSDIRSGSDVTFSHTFETAGTHKYTCVPHNGLGMKGVVVVESN